MKFIVALLFVTGAHASPCDTSWSHQAKPSSTCRLEWGNGPTSINGIELVIVSKSCAQGGNEKEDCAWVRACGPGVGGDKGAAVFMKSLRADSHCISGKDYAAFSPIDATSPSAQVVCSGVGKPKHIKLSSPDGKLTKLCPFPFLN